MSDLEEPQGSDDARMLSALALGVDPVPTPAALKQRILDAARSTTSETAEARPAPGRRGSVARLPLAQFAAMLVIALLAGLAAGGLLGRTTAPPPPAQIARFTLAGHGPLAGVTASVIDLKSDGIALVSFTGLPEAPPGKVYELWLITSDHRADPSGVFLPDANGQRVLVVERPLAGYSLMAVTLEAGPSGTSSPSQQPAIYGTVA